MAKHSGPTTRDLFPSHGINGKGDKDRSPGWREHYDEIDWSGSVMGWEQVTPHKQVKRYGPANPVKDGNGPAIKVL